VSVLGSSGSLTEVTGGEVSELQEILVLGSLVVVVKALASPGTLGETVRVGILVLVSAEGLVAHMPVVTDKPGE
jgi:hypothetical protein